MQQLGLKPTCFTRSWALGPASQGLTPGCFFRLKTKHRKEILCLGSSRAAGSQGEPVATVPANQPSPAAPKASPSWTYISAMLVISVAALQLSRQLISRYFAVEAEESVGSQQESSPGSPAPAAAAGPAQNGSKTDTESDEIASLPADELQATLQATRIVAQSLDMQLLSLQNQVAAKLPAGSRQLVEDLLASIEELEHTLGSTWKGDGVFVELEQRQQALQWELFAAMQPSASTEEHRTYRSLLSNLCLQRQLLVALEAREALLEKVKQDDMQQLAGEADGDLAAPPAPLQQQEAAAAGARHAQQQEGAGLPLPQEGVGEMAVGIEGQAEAAGAQQASEAAVELKAQHETEQAQHEAEQAQHEAEQAQQEESAGVQLGEEAAPAAQQQLEMDEVVQGQQMDAAESAQRVDAVQPQEAEAVLQQDPAVEQPREPEAEVVQPQEAEAAQPQQDEAVHPQDSEVEQPQEPDVEAMQLQESEAGQEEHEQEAEEVQPSGGLQVQEAEAVQRDGEQYNETAPDPPQQDPSAQATGSAPAKDDEEAGAEPMQVTEVPAVAEAAVAEAAEVEPGSLPAPETDADSSPITSGISTTTSSSSSIREESGDGSNGAAPAAEIDEVEAAGSALESEEVEVPGPALEVEEAEAPAATSPPPPPPSPPPAADPLPVPAAAVDVPPLQSNGNGAQPSAAAAVTEAPPAAGAGAGVGEVGAPLLRMVSAGVSMPHPRKAATGGEDAFFVSTAGQGTAGVADGVGGWALEGIDPALYPRQLLSVCEEALSLHETPMDVLLHAHERTNAPGSCTVCLASLQEAGVLQLVTLGDCGMMVIRGEEGVVFRAEIQEHQFNMPYQIASLDFLPGSNQPSDAHQYEVAVQRGDVLVMGSDGLFDNLWEEDLQAAVDSWLGELPDSQPSTLQRAAHDLAQQLAQRAHSQSQDPTYRSPFAVERHEKMVHPLVRQVTKPQGGKMDDVTVVVGVMC